MRTLTEEELKEFLQAWNAFEDHVYAVYHNHNVKMKNRTSTFHRLQEMRFIVQGFEFRRGPNGKINFK